MLPVLARQFSGCTVMTTECSPNPFPPTVYFLVFLRRLLIWLLKCSFPTFLWNLKLYRLLLPLLSAQATLWLWTPEGQQPLSLTIYHSQGFTRTQTQNAKKSSAHFMLSSTSDFYCCSYSEQETPSLRDTKGSTINIVSSVCLRFSTADTAHEVTCRKITETTSPCVRQGADLDMRFLKLPAGLPQSYIWVPFLQACYTDKE